jgi:small subunit ribosomal protein S6
MNQYETTFIVDAHLSDDQIEKTVEKITAFIEKSGAKIALVDRWGKRRLAYEIARKQYGYYVHARFEAEGTFIVELEREYKLDDTVLRYLTVAVTKAALKDEAKRASKKAEQVEAESSTKGIKKEDTEPSKEARSEGKTASKEAEAPANEGSDE